MVSDVPGDGELITNLAQLMSHKEDHHDSYIILELNCDLNKNDTKTLTPV